MFRWNLSFSFSLPSLLELFFFFIFLSFCISPVFLHDYLPFHSGFRTEPGCWRDGSSRLPIRLLYQCRLSNLSSLPLFFLLLLFFFFFSDEPLPSLSLFSLIVVVCEWGRLQSSQFMLDWLYFRSTTTTNRMVPFLFSFFPFVLSFSNLSFFL